MWCYKKPGFEALLLAELQRQQQCSQFCDTLLEAEGVSVPAHSCILSAISPQFSTALSSKTVPSAGQRRLLEFGTLDACTLLHMVRLLYSGEMAGEGEKEKQEAISAAAKMGIHGLVEVTRRDHRSSNGEGDSQHTEVGVQTEPLILEEEEARWGRPASFETIDMTLLQGLRQTDSNCVLPQIPYIPFSLIYPQDENLTPQTPSDPVSCNQESPAERHPRDVASPYSPVPMSLLPFPSKVVPQAADPHSWWAGPQAADRNVVAGGDLENKQIEQFQGNIPGFISHFLNPDWEEGSHGGRARRRGGRCARRAGTGERRARAPRARRGGRGRGGLTQTVDVQDVGVSKLPKLFLQRSGTQACRTSQGGGAVGRTLCLKTRELLKMTKGRRSRGKGGDFCPSEELQYYNKMEGGDKKQRGRRNKTQEIKQDCLPVGRAQRATDISATSVSFSSTPLSSYNSHSFLDRSPSLQLSPPASLMSPAAPYTSASSLPQTTPLPPPAPPSHEDQTENFDRLLEEVMMGLHILPNIVPYSQQPPPISFSSCTYTSSGNTVYLKKQQQCHTTCYGSTEVLNVERGAGGPGSVNDQMSVEQELTEMLNLLQSAEQNDDRSKAREEEDETPPGHSKASAPPKHTVASVGKVRATGKQLKKKRKNQCPCSSEREKVKKPKSQSHAATKIVPELVLQQLRLMPLVKLERSVRLPGRVSLQEGSCQSVSVKIPVKSKISSSPENQAVSWNRKIYPTRSKFKQTNIMVPVKSKISSSPENQAVSWNRKIYPTRSKVKETNIMDTLNFLQPLPQRTPPPGGKQGTTRKNGSLSAVPNDESSASPAQPAKPVSREEPIKEDQEERANQSTVLPQEESPGPDGRGDKRQAESQGEMRDDASGAKRLCFESMIHPMFETGISSSECAHTVSEAADMQEEEDIDVETVSTYSVEDALQREEQEEETLRSEMSSDEIIDVDEDIDIDVIGGCSPITDLVILTFTESSESEEGDEEIDVTSSAVFTSSTTKLVQSRYQPEVLLR